MILNPYEILSIDKTASEDEIAKKYKELVENYTLNQDDTTQEKLTELNKQVLDILLNSNIKEDK